jgi:N6-adenosine-specific RNA methylase IME4
VPSRSENAGYRTIVADPPWEYDGFASAWPKNQRRGGESVVRPLPYKAMSVDDIAALPVRSFAARDARMFCWTTNRYLPHSFSILKAWGAKYVQTLVWHKTNPAPFSGSVATNACEFLLVAVWGAPPRLARYPTSVVTSPRVKSTFCDSRDNHSRKPDAFLDIIESVSPGPYLEMFARRQRLGWDTWGNEALEHVSMSASA